MPRSLLVSFRLIVLVAGVSGPAFARAQTAPVQRAALSEIWSVALDSSRFILPDAIAVAGTDCTVWIRDSTASAWRLPCDGGTPEPAVGAGVVFTARVPFTAMFSDGRTLVGSAEHARLELRDARGRTQRTVELPATAPGDRLYEQLILDEREDAVWLELPGTPAAGVRTWMYCTLSDQSVCRTLVIPHLGVVVSIAFHAGAAYAIERLPDASFRAVKYGAPEHTDREFADTGRIR